MKIRHILTLAAWALASLSSSAQIMLSPMFDSSINGLNENNTSIAEGRLRSIISSLGMESGYGGRFVLACHVAALQREVSGTKIIQQLQVTYSVGDNISNICFGSTSVECTGIGSTEQQAMTSAIRSLRSTPELKRLMSSSKERILDYYNKNAAGIIAKAKGLITAQQWEEALYELTAIPEECKLYPQALTMMEKVYSTQLSSEAQQVLNEAQAIWSADPNPGPNAERAMEILAGINTSAKCYPQAKALMKRIETRVKSVTDTERRNEQQLERARLNADTALRKAHIQACRDVAVAYARRKVVVNRYYRSWW